MLTNVKRPRRQKEFRLMRKSTLSAWLEPNQARSLIAARTVGAVALLVVGGIHYQQYRYALYSVIPTIGPLFIVNFIAATVLGLALLAPFKEARTPRRTARPIRRIGLCRGRGERARRAADQRAHTPVRIHGAGLPIRDRAHDRIRRRSDRDAGAVPDPDANGAKHPDSVTLTRATRRAARQRAHQPTTRHPGSRDVVAIAMQKLCEITIPGLSMTVAVAHM
jgi:hypothetical protein